MGMRMKRRGRVDILAPLYTHGPVFMSALP